MALPNSVIDREKQKFVEDSSGDVAVRILAEDDVPMSVNSLPLPTGAATSPEPTR